MMHKDPIFIIVSEQTAEWCHRVVDVCGKAAGINYLYVQAHPLLGRYVTKYKICRADVKNLTLALRLYKVVRGDLGNFYSIDCAVQELEEKWEKGRSGYDKKRVSCGGGEEVQDDDGMVQMWIP